MRIGSLRAPRMQAAVTELPDGAVLVAGGWSGGRTASIERFDPARGASEKIGELSVAQVCAPVVLADGRVLIMGQETVEAVDLQSLRVTRLSETSPWMDSSSATLLRNGKVLVAGGRVSGPPAAEAWLFDPATARTVATGGLAAPRRKHAAVSLDDGRVLLIGGSGERDRRDKYRALEAYDQTTGRFMRVGETREARFKIPDAAVRLTSGKVLVAGGAEYPELIDPADWSVQRVDVRLGATLNFSSAVALANGDVLVAGGYAETTINPTDQVWVIPKSALA
jgi:hypothetical protein